MGKLKNKICVICERPYKIGKNVCNECAVKMAELKLKAHAKYDISLSKINSLRNIYKQNDILEFLLNNPQLIYKKLDVEESKSWLKYRKLQVKEKTKNKNYTQIPLYIKNFFDNNINFGFINIFGNKFDPFITFLCKKCNEEYIMHFSNIEKGGTHICDSNMSSGEIIIKEFLKKNKFKYKSQYETLFCRNPKTGRALPYDFELEDYKILIEVQGEQHCEYIPYFHGCLENFEYQVYKDKLIKVYALKKGYQLIYLYYTDIQNNSYKDIIEKAIENSGKQ